VLKVVFEATGGVPVQDGAGKARPEGAGSTFEQFLEFVPEAIVGVGIDGEIPYGLKGEEIATIPCEHKGEVLSLRG